MHVISSQFTKWCRGSCTNDLSSWFFYHSICFCGTCKPYQQLFYIFLCFCQWFMAALEQELVCVRPHWKQAWLWFSSNYSVGYLSFVYHISYCLMIVRNLHGNMWKTVQTFSLIRLIKVPSISQSPLKKGNEAILCKRIFKKSTEINYILILYFSYQLSHYLVDSVSSIQLYSNDCFKIQIYLPPFRTSCHSEILKCYQEQPS